MFYIIEVILYCAVTAGLVKNMSKDYIRVGISSCLLGNEVRHDGGHKRKPFIADLLSQHFKFEATCPEIDIGLGVPRPSIRLIENPGSPRLVFVKDNAIDITEKMICYSETKVKSQEGLCGYIFKKESPSCGPDVKVYQEPSKSPKKGKGIFYKAFSESFPLVPTIDEGRFNDPCLRENFVERVYLMRRWQVMNEKGVTPEKIIRFHTSHKLALMAHDLCSFKSIGQMVSKIDMGDIEEFSLRYIYALMNAFRRVSTNRRISNVLQHCQGYLKKNIGAKDKKELDDIIERYRKSELPLIVPIVLLRHHFMHYPNEYISKQTFLNPYADELMLRNKI